MIVEVPDATPVTTPVAAFTVAMLVSEELHAPPVTVDENVVVRPTHTFWVPLNVPALGAAVTTALRVDGTLEQPPVPVIVYVIIAVPEPTPVTNPVDEFTVAILVSDVLQTPPDISAVNEVVKPTHTF